MKSKKWHTVFLFFLGLGTAKAVFAQSADFSGSWTINKEKIEWGEAPQWVLPNKFIVQQKSKVISLQRTVLDKKMDEHDYTEKLSYNGEEQTTVIYTGAKRTSSLKWNDDKKTFTLSSTSIKSNGEAGSEITETWSLADEGKTLVIDRHVEQPDGLKYDIKAYFNKK